LREDSINRMGMPSRPSPSRSVRAAPNLTLPDDERAQAIGEMFQEGITPNLAELLIDLEEEPALRALVVRELRRLTRSAQ
jgi:hypothetical protein